MKKVLIRYFTGTGNSLLIARVCQEVCEENGYDVTLSVIDRDTTDELAGLDLVGVVYPVIALAAPRIVRRYLDRLPLTENGPRVFLMATMGGRNEEGWALTEPTGRLAKKGYTVCGTRAITMPNNWVAFNDCTPPEEAERTIGAGEREALAFMGDIIAGTSSQQPFRWPRYGRIGSLVLFWSFRHLGIERLWRHFKANDDCTSCGLCARVCPTGSINMADGGPVWSAACEQCMRCMNLCPARAIEQLDRLFGGSTHRRYRAPGFEPVGGEGRTR